jgi:hypothetical protein
VESGYATLHGILTAPATAAIALSPWAGAHLATWSGGNPQLFALLGAFTLVAVVVIVLERAMTRVADRPSVRMS